MTAPTRDSRALTAARERAHYGVADEADAALLGESRHGTDRILARNIRAAIEAERILAARGVIPDAPYALDVEPARTRPLHVLLVIAAALVFPAVAVAAIIIERISQ